MHFNTFKCGFFQLWNAGICRCMRCGKSNTLCIVWTVCITHAAFASTPCTEDCTAIYKSFEKKRRTASAAVCLHYTNTQRFWLLFCALDHFSLCIIIQFCVGFQREKTRELESALEKLMWGDECAASKYVNRPSYLCACMRVMKENERRENQINL